MKDLRPALQSPQVATTDACAPRVCAPQQCTKVSPHLPQLKKAAGANNENLAQPVSKKEHMFISKNLMNVTSEAA